MSAKQWLKRVRAVEVKTRLLSEQLLQGQAHSIFTGRGIDFEDVRPYQPGDDVRRIDWNVTARMREPYVKRFIEERELTFIILCDLSSSGVFTSAEQSKNELAAELCGVFGFSAIRSNDRVGMALFTSEVEAWIPPAKGEDHVLHMIKGALFHEPRNTGTNISEAIKFLERVSARPAVVVVISDFMDEGFERAMKSANQRHEMMALNLVDQRDFELPRVGWVTLQDPETGDFVEINTNKKKVRAAYTERAMARYRSLHHKLCSGGVPALDIYTDRPYFVDLCQFLTERSARRLA
ncbi:DUF58 domain-containing protein [Cerasicoccus maritimus]|uniref:DUF58 domain-containing protein n=1 Tax=Cerasicoccus maritimus TaxID=490089 RepID=UPI0028525ACB|nr:DUF58 domain-containing protein [Cerasicoccus maritimus]